MINDKQYFRSFAIVPLVVALIAGLFSYFVLIDHDIGIIGTIIIFVSFSVYYGAVPYMVFGIIYFYLIRNAPQQSYVKHMTRFVWLYAFVQSIASTVFFGGLFGSIQGAVMIGMIMAPVVLVIGFIYLYVTLEVRKVLIRRGRFEQYTP
jgi:hypothetical protein